MIVWLNGTFGAGKTTTAADTFARQWRLDHLDRYAEALPLLRRSAPELIDAVFRLPGVP